MRQCLILVAGREVDTVQNNMITLDEISRKSLMEIKVEDALSQGLIKRNTGDTVVMNEAEEMSQEFLGETITSIREINEEEYLNIFDKDNGYLKPLPTEEKLKFIHSIDYDR